MTLATDRGLHPRDEPATHEKMSKILEDLYREFGLKARLSSILGSRYLLRKIRQEQKRPAAGWAYGPPTFYEKNGGFEALAEPAKFRAAPTFRRVLRFACLPFLRLPNEDRQSSFHGLRETVWTR